MKRALVFSAVALPLAAFGMVSEPSIANAQVRNNTGAPGNFSGLQVPFFAGGAWGSSSQQDNATGLTGLSGPTGPTGSVGDGHYTMAGALFGAGAGYNWQNGPWVAGLAADFSGGSVKGSSNNCGPAPGHGCGTSLNELGTVRGVFGYANGSYLTYLTVGPAWGHIKAYDSAFNVSGSKFDSAFAFGGGLDIMLAPQWSLKIEYLRVDFGKTHLYDILPGVPEQVKTTTNVVRLGLTWYPR
jgi:outer membrane immunogenic protein